MKAIKNDLTWQWPSNDPEYLAAERKKQLRMLVEVAKSLEDVAVREAEQNLHRNRLVCTFRPL